MQTLAAEIALTFIDDAMALIKGGSRIAVRILISPVERLANACDVADVLPSRRSAWPDSHTTVTARRPSRRMFSFHLLNHLS